MANELAIHLTTGLTLYAQRLNSANLVWNGSSYETPAAANWANYDIAMTESGTTGWYYGTDPDPGTLGGYTVLRQAGGSPATTDVAVGAGTLGTQPANVTQISGDATAADNLETMLDGTGGQTLSLGRLVVDNSAGNQAAVEVTGGGSGEGVKVIGGSDSGIGLLVSGGTGGWGWIVYGDAGEANFDLTGSITGNLSGSVGSVTGNVGGNVAGSVGSVATGGITAASVATDAIDAAALAADAAVEIAAAVWDRVLTGATHNVANSAGRRLRQIDAADLTTGTAQGGASNSITLAAGESSTDEIYDSNLIVLTGGTGTGQSRVIVEYNGTTKVATVDRPWEVTPDNTSDYSVIADHQASIVQHGLAQAGAAGSITLSSTASATDDIYNGNLIYLSSSTGAGQVRLITAYDGTTKVATVSPDWEVNPGAATVYKILPYQDNLSAATCNKIADHARRRTQANVEASSDGDALSLGSLYGFIQQAQESSVSGTTLTVKQTDGSTTLGTKTLTVSAAADPVTGIS